MSLTVPTTTNAMFQPVYKGAIVTLLQTLEKYFEWFTSHPGTSKSALSDMLKLQSEILPIGNLLPNTYQAAHRMIESFLVKPIAIHACPNDCILYRKQYANDKVCPQCAAPRYKRSNIPIKKFIYLPLGPRLSRMFNNKKFAKELQSHLGGSKERTRMFDIHDSPVWAAAYSANGIFQGDCRGISLGFCTDGVNPFNHTKVAYSMWPIMMTLLNLPREKRNLFENILLLGIIPGYGTKEPTDLNPYLDVVVDELLELSGTQQYDAYQDSTFTLKVEILIHTLDYPGIGKVLKLSGSGAYNGCVWCNIKGIYSYT